MDPPSLRTLLVLITCCSYFTLFCIGQEIIPAGCNPETCQLPDCFCAGKTIPGGLDVSETPQMVVFTFDDAVNEQVYDTLMDLFGSHKNRTNPNGCPIGMTLFVSHMYTDYCKVADFYRDGHELASHSITHREPIKYWANASYAEYDMEIDGEAVMLSTLGGVPREEITGYRSPFIQPGGNIQFDVIKNRNFTYDSSLLVSTPPADLKVWPYTLDFPGQIACVIKPCPNKPFPGIWELPIQPIPDQTGKLCTFLDRCEYTDSSDEVYDYLMRSFNASYHTNKGPFIVNMHAYWFMKNPGSFSGFERFIDTMLNYSDVYTITSQQLVAWMRNPTPLSNITNFEPFSKACDLPKNNTKCTPQVYSPGRNTTKKSGFEAYKSKMKAIYDGANPPADGGKSTLFVTFLLFAACFVYLRVQDDA